MLTVRTCMKADLTKAMKQREKAAVRTLRSVLAAIGNAEAVEVDESFVAVPGKAFPENKMPTSIGKAKAIPEQKYPGYG